MREATQQDRDEAMRETAKHIRRVQELLSGAIANLCSRMTCHDASKFSEQEWPYFAEATAKLKGLTYGSPEYKQSLDMLKPALDHHNACNSHHPEYFGGDVSKMTLLDLVEMLADWRAATERHADGSLDKSLSINRDRFNIPEPLAQVLRNTAREMGWLGQ